MNGNEFNMNESNSMTSDVKQEPVIQEPTSEVKKETADPNQAMVADATQRYLSLLYQSVDTNTQEEKNPVKSLGGFAKVFVLAILTGVIALGIIVLGLLFIK